MYKYSLIVSRYSKGKYLSEFPMSVFADNLEDALDKMRKATGAVNELHWGWNRRATVSSVEEVIPDYTVWSFDV